MTGSANGVSRSRPFDRWFRYPAGFSPAALTEAVSAAACDQGEVCVDPFAGSASAGTHAVAEGVTFVGIEAHPLIAELANLKFCRPGEPSELRLLGEALVEEAATAPSASSEEETDLVRRCFNDEVLEQLVALRGAVDAVGSAEPWQAHAKWALLATLRDVASVKVGWPYQRPAVPRAATFANPASRFVDRLRMIAEDLADAPEPVGSRVLAGDSRDPATWKLALGDLKADGCVSSPPYLNNFDYADATRLELFFLRQARSWRELCDRVRAPMLVATTQQTRRGVSQAALDALSTYPDTHRAATRLVELLAVERRRRGRGKEYDRVLGPYFLGIARVLACLYESLSPGASCAWVVGDSAPYGVAIDTPALILGLAAEMGFHAIDDRTLRVRGQRWRTNGSRHQVALTERLIVFERPDSGI